MDQTKPSNVVHSEHAPFKFYPVMGCISDQKPVGVNPGFIGINTFEDIVSSLPWGMDECWKTRVQRLARSGSGKSTVIRYTGSVSSPV